MAAVCVFCCPLWALALLALSGLCLANCPDGTSPRGANNAPPPAMAASSLDVGGLPALEAAPPSPLVVALGGEAPEFSVHDVENLLGAHTPHRTADLLPAAEGEHSEAVVAAAGQLAGMLQTPLAAGDERWVQVLRALVQAYSPQMLVRSSAEALAEQYNGQEVPWLACFVAIHCCGLHGFREAATFRDRPGECPKASG